jgi:hypothetical protein
MINPATMALGRFHHSRGLVGSICEGASSAAALTRFAVSARLRS